MDRYGVCHVDLQYTQPMHCTPPSIHVVCNTDEPLSQKRVVVQIHMRSW